MLHGTENLDPTQRSLKVTGTGKGMANISSLHGAPRRAAFTDVSNTAAAKDTGKIRSKVMPAPATRDKENIGLGPTATKTISQSLKVSSGAAPLPNIYGATADKLRGGSATGIHHGFPSTSRPVVKPGVHKKTIIFHDATEESRVGRPEISAKVDGANVGDQSSSNSRHYTSQPRLVKVKSIHVDTKMGPGEDEEAPDAAYEDAVEHLCQETDVSMPDPKYGKSTRHKNSVHVDLGPEPQAAAQRHTSHTSRAQPALPTMSEPEDFSDDEEDQELYEEEQGYMTAHSYRSYGDNTTGGFTTMVAPKVNANVERELEMAKNYVLEHTSQDEIEEEACDISMVTEYGDEIFEYMRMLEVGAGTVATVSLANPPMLTDPVQNRMVPNPHYMDIQTEIQWSMRSVLMDWLVQIHTRFGLLPETLFLTVNFIDRFLTVKIVSLGKLQLVGATAIFVAAKYEEINCPSIQEIVFMVDSGYSVEEILKAERFMLSLLHFELGWPGPMSFLRRISKADDYDLETRTLAKYFLEVTIMDERFVGSTPSYIAAGAHCLARFFLRKGDWTPEHTHYSGYTMDQLRPLINLIFECCQNGSEHHGAVYEKYSISRYRFASTFVEGEIARGFRIPTQPSAMVMSGIRLADEAQTGEYNSARHLVSFGT